MRVLVFLLLAVLVLVMPVVAQADYIWQDKSGGITDLDLTAVIADGSLILAGSSGFVFRSDDNGATWRRVLSVSGEEENYVYQISQSLRHKNEFYAATTSGLFRSVDQGQSWKRIYPEETRSVTIDQVNPDQIFITNLDGVFISQNQGRTWQNSSDGLGTITPTCLAIHPYQPDKIYLTATEGIFFSDNKAKNWSGIYSKGSDEEAEAATFSVNGVAFSLEKGENVYFATSRGVLETTDNKKFKWLSSSGLGSVALNSISLTTNPDNRIIAATGQGVFSFNENKKLWQELYKGLVIKKITDLVPTSPIAETIWAVGDGGVFRANLNSEPVFSLVNSTYNYDTIFAGEPSYRQVQDVAIEYAEVHPEKIIAWRNAASHRALLPSVSVGVDRYVVDLYHWDAGTNPDTFMEGDDIISWDVTVSWDLSDLIWNSSQTSIDTRSRLMVQLRDDILDEVNRLYFERRRVKMDLSLDPSLETKELLEMKLRLEELTAGLDALTGGWFSEYIEVAGNVN